MGIFGGIGSSLKGGVGPSVQNRSIFDIGSLYFSLLYTCQYGEVFDRAPRPHVRALEVKVMALIDRDVVSGSEATLAYVLSPHGYHVYVGLSFGVNLTYYDRRSEYFHVTHSTRPHLDIGTGNYDSFSVETV